MELSNLNSYDVQRILQLGDRNAIRAMRRIIFRTTVAIVNAGGYDLDGIYIALYHTDERKMEQDSVFYRKSFRVSDVSILSTPTRIIVVNEDCLVAAKRLLDHGFNVAVLNMASGTNPGGGVASGAGAQEENLFRRTNLFRSLYQFAPYACDYGLNMSPNQYPMDMNYGGIYTPNATVFRGTEAEGYPLLKKPYSMSFIAVSALNRPALNAEGLIVPHLVEVFKCKMRTVLRIGLHHGHDALVLGAWGCGAYRCPPRHVARLFHEVIMENEFRDKYRQIVFAIIEDHNSKLSHNREGNLKPFMEEFES